jgi:gamma-glutamylcyclotransferase (GGCT)/AIG2-like uncharacterized protein YtfP
LTPVSLPLFVYGTLLTGCGAHDLLRYQPQHPGRTRGTLYRMPAGYPALDPSGTHIVQGCWLDPVPAPLLRLLDQFEGVDQGLYRRAVVRVDAPSASFDAWAWVMDAPSKRGGIVLPKGRWRRVKVR